MPRCALILSLVLILCSFQYADDKPVDSPPPEPGLKKLEPAHLKALAQAIGAKEGQTTGRVHTLTLPRSDLDVNTLELGDIPVEAGLASVFHVFRCGCGKYYILGQFCVTDYESNDVIDALRGGKLSIASVAPMLLQERPRIVLIRFQGEGQIEELIKPMKEAVRWIGENRTKPNLVK